MFIVINNDNVTIKKSLKLLNKKLKTDFKHEDFKNLNNNYILNIDNKDLDYKHDVYELNKVFVNKLYKKDNSNIINYAFFVIMLLLLVITMSSVSGISGMLTQVIEQLPKGAI
ncbi:MAG: hypothetical protein SA378_11245 [Sedimentibacter sp.]|uniref:hypothetical protein n=1 Tax=Sedimentibacter sp. TaxID=1960295 RepID=UPI002981D6F6|nr:hypothetical protein [Sedimentibacter sp.]MDW5300690.1 hypothetical protein [Sedimentibacter sp.]